MAKIETTLSADQVRIAEAIFGETYVCTFGKRDGNPTSRAIPMTEFPTNAVLAIVRYGAQRKFNDALGGSDMTLEAKLAGFDEMVEAFKRGEVAKSRGDGSGVSALEAEIRTLVRPDAKQLAGNAAWKTMTEEERLEAIDTLFAAQPDDVKAAVTAMAQEELARKLATKANRGKLGIVTSIAK